MKTRRTSMVVMCLVVSLSLPGIAQDGGNTIKGRITSLAVDDPNDSRGLGRDERRYVVRVELNNVKGPVLGFGEVGKPVEPHRAMLDLLLRAMENGWTVTLRLQREVNPKTKSGNYSRILSVSVSPQARGAD